MREGPLSTASDLDHGERLLAGMVEVAASGGYAAASVARVAERAGLARRAFYAQFQDRQDCFLAAYRTTVARVRAAVAEAAAGSSPAERPRIVLDCLLRQIAADPAAARLVLFEAYAAPPAVRREHEGLIREIDAEIERFLRCQAKRGRPLQIPATALRGAIADVISIRLLRHEADSLPGLLEDLVEWAGAYRLPENASARPGEFWEGLGVRFPSVPLRDLAPPSLLPRGRSALAPSAAATERRSRILEATIRATAARGYSALTVAEIASAARVTKGAFYSHFASKEEAFLAAQRLGLQESLAAAASGFYAGGDWPSRVWAGLREFLRYLAENPDAVVFGIVEVHAAGEAAIRLEHDTRLAFTVFLEDGLRERRVAGDPLPQVSAEAIAGANYGLIRGQVLSGDTEYLMRILPQAAYVTLAPFLGPVEAIGFIESQARAAR